MTRGSKSSETPRDNKEGLLNGLNGEPQCQKDGRQQAATQHRTFSSTAIGLMGMDWRLIRRGAGWVTVTGANDRGEGLSGFTGHRFGTHDRAKGQARGQHTDDQQPNHCKRDPKVAPRAHSAQNPDPILALQSQTEA